MGVSVENQAYTYRIDGLRQVPAAVRFLSCEPLLGSLQLDLEGINWVIVGGESGFNHRPINPDWVRDILRQTQEQEVTFFFKQWGGNHPKAGGNMLDGKIWEQMPQAWETHKLKWQKKNSKQVKTELEQDYLLSAS